MSHQTMQQQMSRQIDVPFRIKSAAISLLTITAVGIYYAVNTLPLMTSDAAVPDGALRIAIIATVLIAVTQIILQTALVIGTGQSQGRVNHETEVIGRAARNAHRILSVGALVAFGSTFVGVTPYAIANGLLLVFLLSEIVNYGSQIFYYRRMA